MSTSTSDISVKRSALDVERSAATGVAPVDAAQPWLGLASFTEETRGFFHGRDEEVGELGRRVQRKLLTILFGQSGLGKTSILRAGIVPRLRPEGYCPVYVRIDYGKDSPPPAEQIKQAIFRATEAAGHWTQSGVSASGETLWEFLHHRDDVLKDRAGRTLIPLLIFDQFEEVFTLAQTDDFGRRRAAQFIEDLADLVENRAPRALEARLEADEAGLEKFDFARADYRILIALREDYLAHLEGLKAKMPSVTQNRMRLARMTGAQALMAVTGPGGALVNTDVAAAIVRFVAGGADLERAEVEPSLLSLVCRELNNTRLAQGRTTISADLLEGSRDSILSEFYERTLADQPTGVRAFIEDELLTDSGYRESIAEERVKKGLAAAGAAEGALSALIDRRLLRVEERLDVRRVELTHDVLCGVVKGSRDLRQEREAREATARELAAQREREAATQRSLRRARLLAAVALVLMLGAAGSAVFGFLNMRRADRARAAAQASAEQTRVAQQMANTARSEAEQLLSFLVEDFYRDLVANGQAELYAQLAQRMVDYYRRLPKELLTDSSARNQGLALASLARALNEQNRTDEAIEPVTQAIERLRRRRAMGDQSIEAATGLAVALRVQSNLLSNQALRSEALKAIEEAVAVLRPLAKAKDAPAGVQLEFAQALLRLGSSQSQFKAASGWSSYVEAREVLAGLGGAEAKNVHVAVEYAFALVRLGATANSLDDYAGASELAQQSVAQLSRLAERYPGNIYLLNVRGIGHGVHANALRNIGEMNEAYEAAVHSEDDYAAVLARSPSGGITIANLVSARSRVGFLLFTLGRSESVDKLKEALDGARGRTISSSLAATLADTALTQAYVRSQVDESREADVAFGEYQRYFELSLKDMPSEGFAMLAAKENLALQRLWVTQGQKAAAAGAFAQAEAALSRIKSHSPADPEGKRLQEELLTTAYFHQAWSGLQLGRFAEVDAAMRAAQEIVSRERLQNRSRRMYQARLASYRAQALVGLGRRPEAREVIARHVVFMREQLAVAPEDMDLRWQVADVLVSAIAAQERGALPDRRALLAEARRTLDALTPYVLSLSLVREIAQRLATEEASFPRRE